jgi:antitoxin VapB
MPKTAKLFKNGRSQAVRLPADFRFSSREVFIRKDSETGDVILSPKPGSWDDLFALADSVEIPADFLASRDRRPPKKRRLF